ncbi:MAG: cytochrome c oxidase accessory protein CcoG [Pseudomonadota bacterium]
MSAETEEQLYQARVAIHPKSVKGNFRTFKTAVLLLAYAVFFLLPWLRWDRGAGPSQAVMFDLPGRRFYIFDLIIHPQDMFLLAGVLIIFAWFLFFVTGVVGRAFCGYFCFQTLWTDAFMFIERWIQGDRQLRMRLEKMPWNAHKLGKKGLTWLAWLAFAWWSGFTFTAYWLDAPTFLGDFFTGAAPSAAYITTGFLMLSTTVMAGFAREQVCIYMCPYSRFQTVMFDKETLIPSYDYRRGEGAKGRHSLGRGLKTQDERHAAGHGDCVDCGLCVQVCPTGIDIRNGLQIACINCGLCIDACDEIMDKQGWSHGLIRYASEQEIETGVKPRIFKLKTIGYGLAIMVVSAFLMYGVLHQAPMDFAVNQVRNPLAVTLSDGRVQNSYEIKINNKVARPLRLALSVDGLSDAEIEIAGGKKDIEVASDNLLRLLVRVKRPAGAPNSQQSFNFVLTDKDGQIAPVSMHTIFNMPR